MGCINYFLNLAKNAAVHSPVGKKTYRIGAVAIRKDGVLVSSSNLADRQPNLRCHAESRVLRKAGTGATLFVVRVSRNGKIVRLAKPCRRCQTLLRHKKAKKVYYSISANEFGVLVI